MTKAMSTALQWLKTAIWHLNRLMCTLNNLNKFPLSQIIYCDCVDLVDASKIPGFPHWQFRTAFRLSYTRFADLPSVPHIPNSEVWASRVVYLFLFVSVFSFDIWFLFIYFRTFITFGSFEFCLGSQFVQNFTQKTKTLATRHPYRWNVKYNIFMSLFSIFFLSHKQQNFEQCCCLLMINDSQNYCFA